MVHQELESKSEFETVIMPTLVTRSKVYHNEKREWEGGLGENSIYNR